MNNEPIPCSPTISLLSDLPPGITARVTAISSSAKNKATPQLLRRLSELGFLRGEAVRVLRRIAGGEPIAVRIGGSTFALRRHEAECISVEIPQP